MSGAATSRRACLALAMAPWCTAWAVPAPQAPSSLRIGVLPGPHAEVMAYVAKLLRVQGTALQLEIRPDPARLNEALAKGQLDATSVQSAVALEADTRRRRLPIAGAALTLTLPVAIYSRRIARLNALPDGGRLAIPAEGESATRALILLHNHGLLTLRDGAGLHATTRDVMGTRRGMRLVPLARRALLDSMAPDSRIADASLLDYGLAHSAGLHPARDSIGIEDARTPFADVLAVRRHDLQAPWLRHLVATYHSEPVERFMLDRYQESVRRPW